MKGWEVAVKIPMMPKGVEHRLTVYLNEPVTVREDSNDAERR